ncbi:MAG TPA: rod shape-determining protein MreC [Bryobacteraceae bacterium]|nr:rod shape-determining protein MreC [Bryobacteraceae bacterium]
MESVIYRYRNIIVLLIVIFAQLVLLAWQIRNDSDIPMVRVWAVTAVTPVASAIEGFRNGTTGFVSNYFELRNAREQSRQLRSEVDRLKLENQLLKNELASAQRAESLAGFQAHNPSKMIGARVIGATPGVGTRSVLIDRGEQSGVRRGMAVVTPDGIVGNVIAVFPFASQVRTVTDPGFAAGVESQKNHVHGVLKGLGSNTARLDYVPMGQKLEVGELLYTSGEDRVFPKGLLAGKVTSVREGANFQDITVEPSGTQAAPEEVLVIVDPLHQPIPEAAPADTPEFLAPDVTASDAPQQSGPGLTAADKLREQYMKIGDAQKHVFGEGNPGTPPPNFNLKVPGVNAPAVPAGQASASQAPVGQAPATVAPDKKPSTPPSTPAPAATAPPKPATVKPVTPPVSPPSTTKPDTTRTTQP